MKKFDFCVGNPPYNEDFGNSGDNGNYAKPVYNQFMDAAYQVADKVELIHPARFLFNAGSTPKEWNQKMLNDPHLKVLEYKQDATDFFPNTDIKGGVAITYHDNSQNYRAIGLFVPIPEINSMLHKVKVVGFTGMNAIAVSGYSYHFTVALYKDHPELKSRQSTGHQFDLKSNVFDKLPEVFSDMKPSDEHEYACILGRENNSRKYKYIDRSYINDVVNFDKYKLLLPKAIGIGAFGEQIPEPIVAGPGTGHTETFFSIGSFDTAQEAEAAKKYISTKFARSLLSVLKKTQMVTPGSWSYVPIQDFTSSSDIDWSKAISDIDQQLYKKYGFSQEEIEFIESHVKEME